jgi:methylmalonyl-CoA mutase
MTDTSAPSHLAGDFEPANYETWRGLVDKALKGGDFDKRLVATTADGLKIDPLYTRASGRASARV